MLRSFRLKLGLLNVCLTALLLLGFGLFAISALNRVGLDRIDRELRALADAQVRKDQPPGHWRRFDDSLRSIYGEEAAKQFVIKANTPRGEMLYASENWPTDFPVTLLPLSLDAAPESVEEDSSRSRDVPPGLGADPRPPRPFEPPPSRPSPPRRLPVRGPVYATAGGSGNAWRAMTLANENVTLSIAMNLSGLTAETQRFERALLIAVPLGLLLLVTGGWLVGHMALRPVTLIARTAESVTAHRLHERVPDARADEEFKRLILLINGMLERLEKSFEQATRFSADAAHELKTPLAILQAQLERSLQRSADGSPEQREYAEQLDEVQRLKSILRKLLLLSQADSGQLPLSRETLNLAALVRTSADDIQMLAPGRKTTVTAPAELIVSADPDLLHQSIDNLISNAIKFGDSAGAIDIRLEVRKALAVLTVSNTGAPIRDPDKGKIFERFYRAGQSRSREIEGSGLGLSLAREIAKAHGGDLILERSDESGTSFSLLLPLPQA